MTYDRNRFEDFEQLYSSVSRMPEIVDFGPFDAAIRRYSAESRGEGPRCHLLMSISVSETGEVLEATPVTPVLPDGVEVRAVCHFEDGTVEERQPLPSTDDPGVVATAIHLCQLLSFRPAERNGVPVAFPDYRFGLEL